jgi:transcriptional regulator with GAF, ATPase, and Fis domain
MLKMSLSQTPDKVLKTQESQNTPAELERERERLKLLLDMTNTLVSNLELRDLLRAISASIRQEMHCDTVGVWLPDSDRRNRVQQILRHESLAFREVLRWQVLHFVQKPSSLAARCP